MNRMFATTALVATIGLGLAGCGGSSPAATGGTEGGQATAPPGAGAARTPGGSGKVTDVSGSTAQVQSQTAQVAVTWSGSTTFTQQVSVKSSAIKVGSCVMVMSSATTTSTTDTVQASSVRIIPATNGANSGSCTFGRGGGANRPQGQGGTPPTARPSGAPSNGTGRGGFGGTFGKITNVSSTGFTVSSVARPAGTSSSTDAPKSVTVVTGAKTTYTSTAKASSADVKVGRCVTSQGKADDTGAIAATSIAITDPVNGECGFGGFGGRPGGQS
jgi:hypothetical protein